MSKHFKVILLFILTISIFFRLANLGYSNFQGDEVSAQNFLFGEQPLKDFLLTRGIPPGQYLVSLVANNVFQNTDPHFRVRLPFSLAGIGVLIFIFILQKEKSIIALTLCGLSGLLIAFSRIVQYQSFIMLFGIANIFLINKYTEEKRDVYIFGASIISAVAILFHYDSLSYIIPISLFLLLNKDFKGLFKYIVPIILMSSFFYIPFISRAEFLKTWGYLTKKRISSNLSYDALKYSTLILSIYHSREYLVVLGASILLYVITKMKTSSKTERLLITTNVILILARTLLGVRNNFLMYSSVVAFITYILIYIKDRFNTKDFILTELWFFISFLFYGLVFQMPLTHIYTFLLPLFIVISQTLHKNRVLTISLILLTISSISFNYQAFLNTESEYPWQTKNYLFGSMPKAISEGKKISGIFGFPYYRDWQEIERVGKDLKKQGKINYYSNEKYRISKYYLQGIRWDSEYPDYYIHIESPQSLSDSLAPKHLDIISEGERHIIYDFGKN